MNKKTVKDIDLKGKKVFGVPFSLVRNKVGS